jgi:hypothetical protein
MTCRVNSIYLTFGSFNDMDLIIPFLKKKMSSSSTSVEVAPGDIWVRMGHESNGLLLPSYKDRSFRSVSMGVS